MVRTSCTILLIFLFCTSAFADISYKMRHNPQTGRGDWVVNIEDSTICQTDGTNCPSTNIFVTAPSSPSDACTLHTLAEDGNYLYVCGGSGWMKFVKEIWTVSEGWLLAEPDTYLLVEPDTYLRTQ